MHNFFSFKFLSFFFLQVEIWTATRADQMMKITRGHRTATGAGAGTGAGGVGASGAGGGQGFLHIQGRLINFPFC